MSEVTGAGGESEFFVMLAALRDLKVGPLGGEPTDRALARAAGVSPTTVGSWLRGTRFPQDAGKVLAVVRAVAARAAAHGVGRQASGVAALFDEERWRLAYREEAVRRAQVVSAGVQRAQAVTALAAQPAGRQLAEVTDPFTLEVHRPAEPDSPHAGLPVLPEYVVRDHDVGLRRVVLAAADGHSEIAVLVGASSTGKTRACWEALQLLRERPGPWRLWHPIDPSRPAAALRELPSIGPRTVVWLNDAQLYLDMAGSRLGEQVAAGLRELLRDPARAPVLVLATLWPQFWDALTAAPASPKPAADVHEQARKLLDGRAIHVPAAFTEAQLCQLRDASDPRLAHAAATAQDGQVIQFLAGVPELLARYHNAPPAAAALIHAAMDARRLGTGAALPYAFLTAAAPGYLTDAEWDGLDEDWLEQALAYAAVPCKGVRGPLTRIRPRPARSRPANPRPRPGQEQFPGAYVTDAGLYRLADYLDQYGRHQRAGQLPPSSLWAAAADHAFPADQAALGQAAHEHRLYRNAVQLYKNAAACGSTDAVFYLADARHVMRGDMRPVRWAVDHVPVSDPQAVARLLGILREKHADGQVTVLLRRDPAAHASLGDAEAVDDLLRRLVAVNADDQVVVLAARAAAGVSVDDPAPVSRLLRRLHDAGALAQVATLASRAAQVPLSDPARVAGLLRRLRHVGAGEHAEVLASRAAAHAPLGDPYAVSRLLASLREAGTDEQVQLLADRATAHVSLDDPAAVDWLLGSYRDIGADKQITGLLCRDPAGNIPLEDPYAVGNLLERLQEVGADKQVELLAARVAAHTPLDKPALVAGLLASLRVVAAAEHAELLAARAAAHIPLGNPALVTRLLESFRDMNLVDQARMLADRLAAYDSPRSGGTAPHLPCGRRQTASGDQAATSSARLRRGGGSQLLSEIDQEQDRFPFGREADGSPARQWSWEDLD